jgi:uncharacterized protein
MSPLDEIRPLHITFKVASRCNLNCSYCYVYNKADQTWRDQPAFLSDEVVAAAAQRLRRHCERSGQRVLRAVFHGGEPLLVRPERLDRWCSRLKDELADVVEFRTAIQTNATLVNDEWVEIFRKHEMVVGVSLDGPPDVNDVLRVDHAGKGSHDAVVRGIRRLRSGGVPVSILSVIRLGADPVRIHRYLAGLGACQIEYLFPDQTHDTVAAVRAIHGDTPCADFLIAVFDEWWSNGTLDVRVGPFLAMARAILGGPFEVDFIGNNPLGYLFIEPDGSIEGLDVLRVCASGLAQTGTNVFDNDFIDVAEVSSLHRAAVFTGMPLPSGCHGCREAETCAGGYLPHRYSAANGFNNPSAWCADLLRLFAHLRKRLDVSPEETCLRRRALDELAAEARSVSV